jgi:hypothetical protein
VAAHASIWVRPLQAIGQAYFFKRQFDEAAAKLLLPKTIEAFPGHTPFSPRAVISRTGDEGRAIREANAVGRAAGRTDGRVRGTDGSNPSPSSEESVANLFQALRAVRFARHPGGRPAGVTRLADLFERRPGGIVTGCRR